MYRKKSNIARMAIPFIVGVLLAGAGTLPAQAASRLCKVDHYHFGLGSTQGSLRQAKLDAVQAWQSFTAWEYGTAWNRFAASMDKSLSCEKVSSGYRCTAQAKPCRSGRQQVARESTAEKIISLFQR